MKRFAWTLVAALVLVGLTAQAAGEQDVINLIDQMPLPAESKGTVLSGFSRILAEDCLPDTVNLVFTFLQRIHTSGANLEDREALLLLVARAALGDMPVEMLINKTLEGLSRGVPLEVILAEVQERQTTLSEVKALLQAKGIRIRQSPNAAGFPRCEVYAAITDVATVLEDHVRANKDPQDGTLLGRSLSTLQRDGRIGQDLLTALSGVLSEADLARIAENVQARID